eukprot:CAMPEP_0170549724 /NCGR_PEP_ID=MMETSP0211-20121228/7875_1 /TAXON_ID=311385 /ORGANISM="Pseudokeronopsis sp., Strain OXSARD2" /LENGTH=67 /DNA_ID=CAMNT_0010855913 /DNA_START=190 /DNA_END=393 /DNA_ORIENTATION=+
MPQYLKVYTRKQKIQKNMFMENIIKKAGAKKLETEQSFFNLGKQTETSKVHREYEDQNKDLEDVQFP